MAVSSGVEEEEELAVGSGELSGTHALTSSERAVNSVNEMAMRETLSVALRCAGMIRLPFVHRYLAKTISRRGADRAQDSRIRLAT